MRKLLFVFFILITVLAACSYTPPKDLVMQQFFEKNKSTFIELVKMKTEDSQVKWIHRNSSTSNRKSINQARWNKYVKLMDKINVSSLFSEENSVMFFPVQSLHESTHYEKGYIYSEKELKPVYEILDKEQHNGKPYNKIYKKIDDRWYLFYANLNG